VNTDETPNLIHVNFTRREVVRRPAPEQTEAVALDYLTQLRWQLEMGVVDGSLGPLLALSLLDVVKAVHGPEVAELVRGVVRGLAHGGMVAAAIEVARGAAGGFIRSGDHQAGADLLELANTLGRAPRLAPG
jgi:hypothetical protein